MDIEESFDSSFAHKQLCIKTNLAYNILETFKVIYKGKNFMARAKELFSWTPQFRVYNKEEYVSDDEAPNGDNNSLVDPQLSDEEVAGDSDDEGVSDIVFDDYHSPVNSMHNDSTRVVDQHSEDPFGIYNLLNRPLNENNADAEPSLTHPPGFTLEVSIQEKNHDSIPQKENVTVPVALSECSLKVHSKVMNFSQENHVNEYFCGISSFNSPCNTGKGGSILDVLDDMIREKKMYSITHMDVKFMWENSNYQYVTSDSVGNSGGILCVWEDSIFKKDYVLVSDNFIALFGTWLPSMIVCWYGESIVLGDFNEVRSEEERFGSLFNRASARNFINFIALAGLMEIKMKGYSYTWLHPSTTKISKLDRFLVSKGIISNFSSIMGVCLDRHLSDHRPILLKEIHSDFGPSPFHLYHSLFKWDGFDAMIEQTWKPFSHFDSNRLIRFKKKLQDLKKIIRT
nr:RNA-directed DNA polymerase, eukaryota [Tanacetum cinerariifolium]